MPRVLLFFFFTGGLSKPSDFHIRLVRPPQQIVQRDLKIIRHRHQRLVSGLPFPILVPANAVLAQIQFHRQLYLR